MRARVYECILIYFLSFAQLEEISEQVGGKKDCYGFAEAFIFYLMIIIVIITLSVQDSPTPLFFVISKPSNTSEEHKYREERGEGRQGSWLF